jgi:transcription-repair coupling factor (superfamily II helicase)
LIPKTQALNETAERRLKAMMAATELGAGFRIAMKDLEIRGAGNILGAEQSGNIHAVGFDLYTKLLATAVEDLRAKRDRGELENPQTNGNAAAPELDLDESISSALTPDPGVGVDLGIPASLPAEYVADLPVRLLLYQRLIKMTDLKAISEMEDELRDRFGPLPWQAQNLLYMTRLKLEATEAGIEAIVRESERIVLRLKDQVGGGRRALERRLGRYIEVGNTQVRLDLDRLGADWEKPLMETVQNMAEFRRELVEQLEAALAAN